MFAAVDIGGSKTLVTTFGDDGIITEKKRFETPPDYSTFLENLKEVAASLKTSDFRAAGIAIPGSIDRHRGIGDWFGNLSWHNVPIQADAEHIFHCPAL